MSTTLIHKTKFFYFQGEIFGKTDAHNQHQKPKCDLIVATLTGIPPTSAFICPLSSAPFWASDKEQIKAHVM